ncbi:MAG: chloride channel protein [Myxococcales bacterium]|nr:chloride channel protein [Myxococcales bacterium]
MAEGDVRSTSSTDALPVAPSMGPGLAAVDFPRRSVTVNRRDLLISLLAIVIGVLGGLVAKALFVLIGLITNVSFYGRWSTSFAAPQGNHLGVWVIGVPVAGGIIVGLMARFGAKGIRGHGIPEAMEQVLFNESRVRPRLVWLKPISSAFAIGTGGPFGAEGPIIATGAALGSVVGQLLRTTADERKVLLSAGAAAGMAATFMSPVSAVLLSVELLLFEYRPRSLIPTSLASVAATSVRIAFEGASPIFPMPHIAEPGAAALATYVLIGALVGVVAVGASKVVYWVEDVFGKTGVHWMWWPALGAIPVGVIGYFAPETLGVGYSNITGILSGSYLIPTLLSLSLLKFASWSVALGSNTAGGTLAPLFTIGGACGAILGIGAAALFPAAGIDPRIAALVGMASIFAGAARALMASAVFAFEATLQPLGLLPVLGGCAAAYLVASRLSATTIMTEKLARRGAHVVSDYVADYLEGVRSRHAMTRPVTVLRAEQTLGDVRAWLASKTPEARYQGFPIVDVDGHLCGVLTRLELLESEAPEDARVATLIQRAPVFVYEDTALRSAADLMAEARVGRLPVLSRATGEVAGILSRSDILDAHRERLREAQVPTVELHLGHHHDKAASA